MWWTYRCGAEINVDSIIEVLTKEGNLTRDKFAKLMCSYASSDRRDYDITGPIKSSHWKKRVSFWDNNYGFSDDNFPQNFWWFFYLEKNRGSKFIFNPNFAFSVIFISLQIVFTCIQNFLFLITGLLLFYVLQWNAGEIVFKNSSQNIKTG